MSEWTEAHAALLQGVVTLGTALLCWYLFAKYRRRYFLWWSVAWSMYVLRDQAAVIRQAASSVTPAQYVVLPA